MDQQRSRAAATPTTTKHAPPTPWKAAEPEPVVTGCLYEAGFSTTGPHPQGGVAIARSIHDAVNSAMKAAEPFGGVGGQPERGPPVGGSAVQPQLEHRTPRLRRSPRDPLTCGWGLPQLDTPRGIDPVFAARLPRKVPLSYTG